MKVLDLGNSDCREVLPLLNHYLSNELTAETCAQVLSHLERCPSCLQVFRIREQLKGRLHTAVSRTEVPSGLVVRVLRLLQKAGTN